MKKLYEVSFHLRRNGGGEEKVLTLYRGPSLKRANEALDRARMARGVEGTLRLERVR